MGAPTRWALAMGVILVGLAWSAPLSHPVPAYHARLTPLELAIIKCIVDAVPGVTEGSGEWSVVQSTSKELEGVEIEVVQVGQREPHFTGGSGGVYPSDLNIVRSVSSQLAARENGAADSHTVDGEGLSDNWSIVQSISTELHLDVEEVPGDGGIAFAYHPPVRQAESGNTPGSDMVMFPGNYPISSGQDTSDIDIRLNPIDLPAEDVMDFQRTYAGVHHGGENIDSEIDEYHQHFVNDGSTRQTSGEQTKKGGAIGWSIVRSISSEQEPISEDVSLHGNEQSTSSSETQEVMGDNDSYNVVRPISTELQPGDNEAGEVLASLTEIFPPAEGETGGAWNSPPLNGAQASEVHSSETDKSAPLVAEKPCEKGHKRIRNVCRMVYTFQLKSHLR